MSYKGLPEQLVARIKPVDVRGYAFAAGWKRLSGVNGKVAVYTHPSSDLDQLIIPLDTGLGDYPLRMAEVLANLADKEGRPASLILDDLLLPPSDVLRFRVDEPASRAGYLPLEQGIDLLTGAKKALLSAACSVIQPQSFHPRLNEERARQLVRSSNIGQSERGSYTTVISCPLHAEEVAGDVPPLFILFEEETANPSHQSSTQPLQYMPFARRVTSFLMRSLARIPLALDNDDPGSLLKSEGNVVPLSANLCEALMAMQPSGDQSQLHLTATWSRSLPPPQSARPPSSVELRREYFPMIQEVAARLRPVHNPKSTYIVGLVDSMHGDPDVDNVVQGEVQLSVFGEENIKARVTLGPEDYQTALRMHGMGGFVSLDGVLMRSGRLYRISDVANFKALRDAKS